MFLNKDDKKVKSVPNLVRRFRVAEKEREKEFLFSQIEDSINQLKNGHDFTSFANEEIIEEYLNNKEYEYVFYEGSFYVDADGKLLKINPS